MRRSIPEVLLACALVLGAGAASASEFDEAMKPLLGEYLKIHGALAADKTEGVKEAAEAIQESAKKLDVEKAGEGHSEHFRTIPEDIGAACGKLRSAQDIGEMREAFKALSRPIAMWVGMAKPKETSVMYCPMVETVWVQHGSDVANPYYGSKMLTCGQKVGGSD